MDAEYVTPGEADRIISRWASSEANVVLTEELGDLAAFVQRRGKVELVRPGLPAHRSESGDVCTALFFARFGEIVYVEDDAYEVITLRRAGGAPGLEVTLVMDPTDDLGADDILLLVQTLRGMRPPVQ